MRSRTLLHFSVNTARSIWSSEMKLGMLDLLEEFPDQLAGAAGLHRPLLRLLELILERELKPQPSEARWTSTSILITSQMDADRHRLLRGYTNRGVNPTDEAINSHKPIIICVHLRPSAFLFSSLG